MTKPESYPFLRIAKQYGVDYGDVLTVADMWRHPADRDDRERAADKRLFLAMRDKPVSAINWLARDLRRANMQFLAIQAGKIDWQTGKPIERPLTMDGFAAHIQRMGRARRAVPGPAEIVDYSIRLEDQKPVCKYCGQDHATTYPNGARMFADDCTMLDENGNRSIFDDVDH